MGQNRMGKRLWMGLGLPIPGCGGDLSPPGTDTILEHQGHCEAGEMNDGSSGGAREPGTSQPGVIRGERFWTDILLTTDKHTMQR